MCAHALQEEDQAVLVVVDVYGGQVQPIPPSVSQRHRAKEARRQQHEAPLPPLLKVKQCAPHQVDYQLFASRKGLVVRQVRAGAGKGAPLACQINVMLKQGICSQAARDS